MVLKTDILFLKTIRLAGEKSSVFRKYNDGTIIILRDIQNG